MSKSTTIITRDSSPAEVLDRMLSDRVRYPCLSSMIYKIAEALDSAEPELSEDMWSELNLILSGNSDPASVRRFVSRHGSGHTSEARAFNRALMYLLDEDEGRRSQYLSLGIRERQHFVGSRLWRAGEMQVEQAIAL